MFFYFSPLYFWKKSENNLISKMKIWTDTFKRTIPLIQKISYIIAFFFFYLSLYWISYSFWGNLFPIFILIISLIISSVFYINLKKQKLVVNLIFRANYFIFSFLYILFFINKIVYSEWIDNIFILNSFISFIWLLSVVLFDKIMDLNKKKTYFIYMISFFNIANFFFINYYFNIPLILLSIYICFIYSIFYFEYLWKIKYLSLFDNNSKIYWIILNYISIISSFVFLFYYTNYWHFALIIFISMIFNYLVHYRYKNYFSYFLVFLSLIVFYLKYFIPLDINNFVIYIIFIYLLPTIFIIYTYLVKEKYNKDNYMVHSIAILFTIISIITYLFMSKNFDILSLSIIFLLESFILFWSFAKLKTIKNV